MPHYCSEPRVSRRDDCKKSQQENAFITEQEANVLTSISSLSFTSGYMDRMIVPVETGFSFQRGLRNPAAERSDTSGKEITLVFLLVTLFLVILLCRYVCTMTYRST